MRLIVILQLLVVLMLMECKIGLAAPPVEPCPYDSAFDGDACVCDASKCEKPPCPSTLVMVNEGGDVPGSCCPLYACVGCKNDTLLQDKCPCAAGAVINSLGSCVCVDPERHLVDGTCVCDPARCPLPQLCDTKSVLVTTSDNGCCKKTRCVQCPLDSESTSHNASAKLGLEDHCVCLPCSKPDCGAAKRVVIIKKGTLLPGNCCALYECKPLTEDRDCVVGDIIYENGEEWSTDDQQRCQCGNGISRCAKKEGEELQLQNCWDEAVMYKHNETWLKDRGCTFCTCLDGEPKCISHYCDFKERKIAENESLPCYFNGKNYGHLENMTLIEECKLCTCDNGSMSCTTAQSCNLKEVSNEECRPLFDCNKRCPNGFRINKKGCETCKCNPGNPLLSKYNITYSELVDLLEDYKRRGSSTSTSTSTSIPTVIIVRRFGDGELEEKTQRPDDGGERISEKDKSCWIIISALTVLIVGIGAGIAGYCTYRNRRQYSITPSRGSYHSVTLDNNNTIKKNTIRFDSE